jgi:hypothetical protein
MSGLGPETGAFWQEWVGNGCNVIFGDSLQSARLALYSFTSNLFAGMEIV